MGELPAFHARRKGDRAVALIYPDALLTWAALDQRANRYARRLAAAGVSADDRVAIALQNGIDLHIVAFACWKIGASPAPISPIAPAAEARAILEAMAPRILVTRDPIDGFSLPWIDCASDASTGVDPSALPSVIGSHWKVACSGGSTGTPKVIVANVPGQFDPRSAVVRDIHQMRIDGTVLNTGPLYHAGPFLFAHVGLFTGSTLVGMVRFDAEEALRLIERHRVNWAYFVPAMMHRISSLAPDVRDKYDMSSLDAIWHLAAPCPAWLKQMWIDWLGPERVWERYGGSEGFGSTVIRGDQWLRKRGSVGRVIGGTKVKIAGPDGAPLGPGEVGEVRFLPAGGGSPSFYLGADEVRDREGYLTLGDLGHLDEDGFLFLADRRTDLIVRGGVNIYPAEVEAALSQHPQVAGAAVIGLPCDELGARVHAIIEPRSQAIPDLAELHAFAAQQLSKIKLPESYELVAYPLRDGAGKTRRGALRADRVATGAGRSGWHYVREFAAQMGADCAQDR